MTVLTHEAHDTEVPAAQLALPGGMTVVAEVFDEFADPAHPPVVSVWTDYGQGEGLDADGLEQLLSQLPAFQARLQAMRDALAVTGGARRMRP
ncbi:DUF6907 domain-containing protein [Streptomyces sp. NPDC058045]|uniref:DUF6907 domain-containing protein n=1 Tax=Streptomyces sp. NPDC058045 TaxID=3346311 RepID=UPI0036E751BD